MNPVTNAVSGIATFGTTISGVKHSYDLTATTPPDKLTPSHLPALLIDYPVDPGEWASYTFQGGGQRISFVVTQLALLSVLNAKNTMRRGLPEVEAFIDALLTQLKTMPYLVVLQPGISPPVHAINKLSLQPAAIPYGDLNSYGLVMKWDVTVNL